jgi:hypothetical protein
LCIFIFFNCDLKNKHLGFSLFCEIYIVRSLFASFAIIVGTHSRKLAGTSAARGRWKGSGGCNLPADGTTEVTEVALLGLDYSSLLRLHQALILALPRIV